MRQRIDWTNTVILTLFHLAAAFAIVYLVFVKVSPWTLGLGCLWIGLTGIAITGGYHRLFAHRAYRARGVLRAFYLLFGAASVQNSALKWAADHRLHHAYCDQPEDPYSIQRGFWWAHIGWVLFRSSRPTPLSVVADLSKDPLVRLQHRFYVPLALLMGAVIPVGLGLLWGDPLGALLVVGFLRLVVQWHVTFCVNSVAHTVGKRPFSRRSSARDSVWTAILTLGEGYHNFHHRFGSDYRNGVHWYQFDPTKWFVWTMARLGLARNLRRVTKEVIERAKMAVRAEVGTSTANPG
jgi:stearoyl-CoA desaturase (delta-9 desaturase)